MNTLLTYEAPGGMAVPGILETSIFNLIAALGAVASVGVNISRAQNAIFEIYDPCGTARPIAITQFMVLAPLTILIPGCAWILAEHRLRSTLLIRCAFWGSVSSYVAAIALIKLYCWFH